MSLAKTLALSSTKKSPKEPAKEIQTLFTEIQKHPYWSNLVKFQEKIKPKLSKFSLKTPTPKVKPIPKEEVQGSKKMKRWLVLDQNVQKTLEKTKL
jgi:hypothetical protein